MEINFLAVLVAALSSFVVGFVWYNPKVFGTIWMNEIGMTEEKAKQEAKEAEKKQKEEEKKRLEEQQNKLEEVLSHQHH